MERKLFLIFIFSFGFLLPFIAFSQGLVPCGPGTNKPTCQLCDLFVLLNNIFRFLLIEIVPLIAVILIAIGGLLFILGQENPKNIDQAKEIFKSVGIGLLLIFSAWLIVNLFLTIIGVAEPDLREWFKIKCP
jgi:hypothetical protein